MDRAPAQRTLGRYELFESLGRGSAFEAFRAKSFGVEGFEKTLVVKQLQSSLGSSAGFVDAFLEQMQRAMRLSHANLAQVFDLGHDEETGTYFIATEFVSGCDVATLLARCQGSGDLPPLALATYMALEVAKALDHAHRRKDEQMRPLGIVHGAVAPHNVLVSFDGDVKLTDFGVTRSVLTLPGPRAELIRAYPAISPEQAAGQEPTTASDVFSLGTFLFFLIAGTPPFVGATPEETLANIRTAAPTPLEPKRSGVPGPLADLVQKALARDPDDRFRSISALYEELLACTYACGLRCSPADLGAFVDRYREPGPSTVAQDFDELLSRPLTEPPPPPMSRVTEDSTALGRPTSIPPLTGFGELRHVSALVLALSGSERPSDDVWTRLRAIVARYGGALVHEDENEAVALFGLDRSDGRDTEAAVRAGLVLVRGLESARLAPAVGIDAGRLRLAGGDEPVPDDRAMRLIDSARSIVPGSASEVIVSRRVASSLRGRFPLETRDAGFRVKEFAQERFGDAFVGRRTELIHLAETLVRAARGELRIISIVGDPGIGKTRLAVEMQQRLARGPMDLATYFATCSPRGREIPYSGITVMLRRVCGVRDGDPQERIDGLEPRLRALGLDADEVSAVKAELGGTATTARASASTALRSGVTRMMHSLADDRFTVFVWDDAHELDAATSDLLSRATSRLSASRVALVFCARPDPGAPYQVLEANSELRLGEMDAVEVEQLVMQRAGVEEVPEGLIAFLRERAGGQPMFVEELLRQLMDGGHVVAADGRIVSVGLGEGVVVPRTLRALTSDRLRRLKDDERHLFVAAAVLEPPVDLEVLSAMLGLPFSAVDAVAEALVADGLLSRDGSSFGFPLPLAREVVITELDPADLVKLHRKAAEAHASVLRLAGDGEADRIGYHLAAAGDRDAASELYAKSGVYYLGARQLDRAALDLAYALDLVDLERRPAAQVGNWLRALSTAVRYVRTGADLPGLIERLVARVDDERMDVAQRTAMRIDLASMLGALNQELSAEALLDRGAVAARNSADLIAGLLAARADLASGRGEFRLARRALDPLSRMTIADRVERHRITLSMARTLGASGQADAAEVALDDATRLASRDDPLLALDRAVVRIVLYEFAGKWREAADAAVQAATQAEELGLFYEVASCLSAQAAALARAGEFARAEGIVASALAAADELRAERLLLRAGQVQSYLEAEGDATQVLAAFRGHVADAESHGWISDALLGRHFLGLLALRLGARDEARRELLLASRIATSTGNQALADQSTDELARI
jgi:eukaryotic-like serine/threonine-protein kinase